MPGYNYGYSLPGQGFVRAKVGRSSTADLAIVPYAEAVDALQKLPDTSDKYITAYRYEDDTLEGRLWGRPYFDVDTDPDHLERALIDTRIIVNYLLRKLPSPLVRVFFSGAKGFSIELCAPLLGIVPSHDLNIFYGWMAKEIAEATNVKSLDLGIYDRVRLWRVPNTRNSKSGRYKVPITLDELNVLTIDQILNLAERPREISDGGRIDLDAVEVKSVAEFISRAQALYQREQAQQHPEYTPVEIRPLPEGIVPPCISTLRSEVLREGDGRNRALFIYGNHQRRQGRTTAEVEHDVRAFNSQFEPQVGDTEVKALLRSIAKTPYSVGCRTPELSERCPGRAACYYFQRNRPTPEIVEQGMAFTDTPKGFIASADGWSYAVTEHSRNSKGIYAQIKLNGPGGESRFQRVSLTSAAGIKDFIKPLPAPSRPTAQAHLEQIALYLAERPGLAPALPSVATSDDYETVHVIAKDGCYYGRRSERDGGTSWVQISNYTIEVRRLLHEVTVGGETQCVREVIMHHKDGSSTGLRRLAPNQCCTPQQITEWSNAAGNYSWTGANPDLQYLKSDILLKVTDVDEAYVLDHIGMVDTSYHKNLFLAGNIAVADGKLYYPHESSVFSIGAQNFQLRSLNILDTTMRHTAPHLCTDYVDKPEELKALKRAVITKTYLNQGDYKFWLMAGMAYASIYLNEIVETFGAFPGLYLVGPMGAGKNTLARWVMSLVGMPHNVVMNLPATTSASLTRQIAYYSGLPVVLDEFRNTDRMEEKVHMMRSWYDRNGRSVSQMGNHNSTVVRPVRGWMLLAGQDISTDAAFNSRFVTSVLVGIHENRDQSSKLEIDALLKQSGSAIFLDLLMQKTPERAQWMIERIRKYARSLQEQLEGSANERSAFNYAVATAGWQLAFGDVATEEEAIPFRDWIVKSTKMRHAEERQGSEAIAFLRDIPAMTSTGHVSHGVHYAIQENRVIEGTEYPRILALWLKGTVETWTRWKRIASRDGGFSERGLYYALRSEPFYIGEQNVFLNTPGTSNGTYKTCVLVDLLMLNKLTGEWNLSQRIEEPEF